jgi:Metallo-beta-lactamase superfamily
MQVQMLRPGLWRWTTAHPEWTTESVNWGPEVGCVYLETPEAIVLVDPLVPADAIERDRFWRALDRDIERRGLPVVVVATIAWHERSCADIVTRCGARSWTTGEPAPSDVQVIPIPIGAETLVLATAHRALITGDLLIGGDDGLEVCPASWLPDGVSRDDVRDELRVLLDLDIEMVLPSHGEPVLAGGAAALRAALA